MSVHEAMKNACDITHLKEQISILHSLVEEKDIEIDKLNRQLNRQIARHLDDMREQEVEIESLRRMLAEHGYGAVEVDYFVARCKAVEAACKKMIEFQEGFTEQIRQQFAHCGVKWKEWNDEK